MSCRLFPPVFTHCDVIQSANEIKISQEDDILLERVKWLLNKFSLDKLITTHEEMLKQSYIASVEAANHLGSSSNEYDHGTTGSGNRSPGSTGTPVVGRRQDQDSYLNLSFAGIQSPGGHISQQTSSRRISREQSGQLSPSHSTSFTIVQTGNISRQQSHDISRQHSGQGSPSQFAGMIQSDSFTTPTANGGRSRGSIKVRQSFGSERLSERALSPAAIQAAALLHGLGILRRYWILSDIC